MLSIAVIGGTAQERDWVRYIINTYLQPYVGITLDLHMVDVSDITSTPRILDAYPVRVGLPGIPTSWIDKTSTSQTPYYGLEAWALIGTDALSTHPPYVTAYIGTLDYKTSDSFTTRGTGRVIVHEFMHILGFIHEHQRPDVPIQWNVDNVYRYFSGPPNYMTRKQIDTNIFDTYASNRVQVHGEYDPHSIMHYMYPQSLILNYDQLGLSQRQNTHVSDSDIIMLNRLRHGYARSSYYDPYLKFYTQYTMISILMGIGMFALLMGVRIISESVYLRIVKYLTGGSWILFGIYGLLVLQDYIYFDTSI